MGWKKFESGWNSDYTFEPKKIEKPLEKKSADPNASNASFVQFLQDNDNWDLSFAVLFEYFQRCSPFSNAVAIIAKSFASIPLHVRDRKTGDFVENHQAIDFLMYPNADQSYEDFAEHFASMYLITGSPFVNILGSYNRDPASIDILNPRDANPQADSNGSLGAIIFNSEFNSKNYIAEFDKGRTRYRSGNDNEVWPSFAFNPFRGSRIFWGTSTAQPLYYEIEQYIQAGVHNKTLLKRGARPGGMFTAKSDTPLTDEQVKRFQDQIDIYYMGANNAGRPLFGENIDYKEHIISNREMDYKSVVDNSSDSIYRQFQIPLPMVSNKASTYSNYETSQVSLYDRAVLPLTIFLYRQMTMAMMYRFEKDWKRYEFAYDESEIGALQLRRNESIKIEKDIAVSTVNELRQKIGKEPIEGGDVILRSSSDVPALDGSEDIPDQLDGLDEDEKRLALEKVLDISGNPRFTPEQVELLISK